MLDKLIKDCSDKETFECKDMQAITLKTKLGEIPITRRRYKMVIDGKVKRIYLLDEFLQINEFRLYSKSIVEMVAREITKKSYRETAKTISEDTENVISHTAVKDDEYLKKMQKIVYTEKPEDIFSLIYNYKVELETDKKLEELKEVQELEEYLRNTKEGLLRYQYKLGYEEEQLLEDILSNKAKERIEAELAQRIAEPIKIKKIKQGQIIYAGKYQIASNFTGSTKEYLIDLLRGKKCSEILLIN